MEWLEDGICVIGDCRFLDLTTHQRWYVEAAASIQPNHQSPIHVAGTVTHGLSKLSIMQRTLHKVYPPRQATNPQSLLKTINRSSILLQGAPFSLTPVFKKEVWLQTSNISTYQEMRQLLTIQQLACPRPSESKLRKRVASSPRCLPKKYHS